MVSTSGRAGEKLAETAEKGQVWFTDGACNQQGIVTRIRKYQSKIQRHISQGQDATAFQIEDAVILGHVTSSLRKKLKGRIIICTDSQMVIAALCTSETKLLLVADCTEKLTVVGRYQS